MKPQFILTEKIILNKDLFIDKLKKYISYNNKIIIRANNSSIISIKQNIFVKQITLHPVFIKCSDDIFIDLINFLNAKNKNKDSIILKNRLLDFFYDNKPIKKQKINLDSKHYDLKLIYDEIIDIIKNIYILNYNKISITWGKKTSTRRRSIRFGSFNKLNNIIRIHPILDDNKIPLFFLKSVILHEIAHFIYIENGYEKLRKTFHNKYFYEILVSIDNDHEKSKQWQKENLKLFLK